MGGLTTLVALSLALAISGLAQVPQVNANSIVNAASWSSPVSPGALAAVFGMNLASTQQSAAPPYPTTLGGTSVAINGAAAPLLLVSPTQINFQMPASVANSQWFSIVSAQIVVTTSAGSSAPVTFGLGSMPGLFTADVSGCGQAAALNISSGGNVSVNSPSNSAAPGDYIALFGTGLGFAGSQPPDGTAATGPAPLQTVPGLLLNETTPVTPVYAGLAPTLPGVNQVNFQLPASTRNGCAVPVTVSAGLSSPEVTIAVQSARGQCADPPVQSYGEISLNHFAFFGPTSTASSTMEDSFTAIFPAAPGLEAPAPEPIVFAPNYVANTAAGKAILISSQVPVTPKQCGVPGYTHLSAGPIQIQAPGGASAMVNPVNISQTVASAGVSYAQVLPSGVVTAGTYRISGAQGSAVSLTASVQVGSPVQLQTAFAAGTTISSSQPVTIRWTGGDANSLVRLSLCTAACDYTYAHATDGSLTLPAYCVIHTASCTFLLGPQSVSAQVSVDVVPASAETITAPGVTGPVRLSWSYGYRFAGLTLGP